MAGQSKPKAQPPYRVPRSRVDERFNRSSPLPSVRVGAGEVVSVSADGETMTVRLGGEEMVARSGDEDGEEVSGVVALGCPPDVGDWVEVQQRGNLLVSPEAASDWWTISGGGEGGGGGTGNMIAWYKDSAGTWPDRPSTTPPPGVVVQWIGVSPPPDIVGGPALIGDLYLQTDF
jgi:hypothetical protein